MHDDYVNDVEKKVRSGFKWLGALWLFCFLSGLALAVGAIYVVLHFLAKFW